MPPALCHRWTTALPLVLLLASSSSAWAATTTYTTEAAFLTAAGTPILIDFDGLSNNDSIDTQFVGSGATFGPFNGGGPQAREVTVPPFCVENHSEPTSFDTTVTFMGGGGFRMSFSPPADAVGLWIGDLETLATSSILNLEDAGGESLGTFNLNAELGTAPCEWRFFGVTSDQPIHAATIAISVFDYVFFDDVYFEAAAPPVPALDPIASGLLLSILAAAGVALLRRNAAEHMNRDLRQVRSTAGS